MLPVAAGGQLGVLTVQAVGQHRHRVAHLVIRLLGEFGQAFAFAVQPLAAGQFGVGAGAWGRVSLAGLDSQPDPVLVFHPFVGGRR
jgi:hypothetical protein